MTRAERHEGPRGRNSSDDGRHALESIVANDQVPEFGEAQTKGAWVWFLVVTGGLSLLGLFRLLL